jgi:PAS domain S-box-containing protein
MADAAPVLMWENGSEGAIPSISTSLTSEWASFDSIRGMGWTRFLHPEDAESYFAPYQAAFVQGEPFVRAVRSRRADGQYRWLLTTGRPLNGDRLIGFFADISDLKQAQEDPRNANDRLNRALEVEAVGVLFFETDGTLIGANEAFLQMTGNDRNEVDRRRFNWRTMTPPGGCKGAMSKWRNSSIRGASHHTKRNFSARTEPGAGFYSPGATWAMARFANIALISLSGSVLSKLFKRQTMEGRIPRAARS